MTTNDRPELDEGLTEALALLGTWTDEEPPEDGLARVMTAIGSRRPARRRANEWLLTAVLGLAGVAAGGLLIYVIGLRLVVPPDWLPQLLRSLAPVSGFVLAAFAFFGAGSLLTLALAPMLLLDLERGRRPLAG